MCGIAGFAVTGPAGDAERQLRQMSESIRHRGPDGEGFAKFSACDGDSRKLPQGLSSSVRRMVLIHPLLSAESASTTIIGIRVLLTSTLVNVALRGGREQ